MTTDVAFMCVNFYVKILTRVTEFIYSLVYGIFLSSTKLTSQCEPAADTMHSVLIFRVYIHAVNSPVADSKAKFTINGNSSVMGCVNCHGHQILCLSSTNLCVFQLLVFNFKI